MTVAGHDDGSLEFIVDGLLNFFLRGWLVRIPRSLIGEPPGLLLDQLKAVVNGQIFGNVVNDQVETSLEYPRGSEEAWPRLHRVVEHLGLRWHKKSRVSSDLTEFGIAHLGLNDRVDEVKSKWMIFHLHGIQIIECKLRHTLDGDRELTAKVSLFGFEVNSFVEGRSREDIVTDTNVVHEYTLELSGVSAQNFVLLECFEMVS